NNKNKLLSKFFQRLEIQDACSVHSVHQRLKLGLCGIRMFSTHVQPGEALASLAAAQSECDANHCVYRFPTLAWRDGQLRKKGAFRCEPLPRYRTLHL